MAAVISPHVMDAQIHQHATSVRRILKRMVLAFIQVVLTHQHAILMVLRDAMTTVAFFPAAPIQQRVIF